jgi:hypothetical protein
MPGRVPFGGPLPPPVDLVFLGTDAGAEAFCRNWQGLHVPLVTMDIEQRQRAWANRKQFEGNLDARPTTL